MLTNREKLTAQAQKYVERGQYDRAIREYQKIVAEDEKDVRTWLKIGDLYAKSGHKSEAAHTYQRVAKFYSDQGFYLKAVAVYKQILKLDPRLVEINLALAELYRQLGLLQEAVGQYEAAASFLQRDGRAREAVAAHAAILEMEPDNVAQRIKLAELYSKENLLQDATREFTHIAHRLREQGRVDDFLKVGERLLFHDPHNRAMAKELAALYLERGDARRALTKLQATYKADPQDVETLELLSQVFLALNQNQKCISVLKELARIYNESQRKDQAGQAYQRVLEIDPEDPEARAALGPTNYTVVAETSSSLMAVPEVLEYAAPDLQRDEEVARIVTEADVYAKYGLYNKAVEHLQRARDRLPGDRAVRKRLYELFDAGGQSAEAIRELWGLIDLSMTQEEAAFYLGEILRIDPRNDQAVQRWKQIRAAGASWQGAGASGAFAAASRSSGASGAAGASGAPGASESPGASASQRTLAVKRADTGEGEVEINLEVEVPIDVASGTSSPPQASRSRESVKDELDEVDFFLRQGLQREARHLLEGLHGRYPEDVTVAQRLRELESAMAREGAGPREREMSEAEVEVIGPAYEMTRQGFRERGPSREGAASSFELGQAYRGTGMYGDAIVEFRKAMGDPRREVECRKLIGLCYLEQEQHAEAVAELKRALYVKGISDEELTELYYHLGRAYEQLGDTSESIYFYEKALKHDPRYRDALERLAELRHS